jgi:hypothetical protein
MKKIKYYFKRDEIIQNMVKSGLFLVDELSLERLQKSDFLEKQKKS